MISDGGIRELTQRLVEAADPVRVLPFGSYAEGTAGPDSDPDLLVVERRVGSAAQEMARLRKIVGGASRIRWATRVAEVFVPAPQRFGNSQGKPCLLSQE